MKIIHVNLARGFRGGERQTLNLIEGLSRLGTEQALVCRSGSDVKKRASNMTIRTIEIRHPALGHLKSPRAEIIHVHERRGVYWAAIEHAIRKLPYIITRRIPTPISKNRLTSASYKNAAELFGVSHDVSNWTMRTNR